MTNKQTVVYVHVIAFTAAIATNSIAIGVFCMAVSSLVATLVIMKG
ncbi:MAG: hypothetical protein ABSG70_03335 [Terriglobales bacterium]